MRTFPESDIASLTALSMRTSASSRSLKLPFCWMAEIPITTDLCFIFYSFGGIKDIAEVLKPAST